MAAVSGEAGDGAPPSGDRKTGNEPISGTDPGWTRPARPGGSADKPAGASKPPVQSGDQNDNPQRP